MKELKAGYIKETITLSVLDNVLATTEAIGLGSREQIKQPEIEPLPVPPSPLMDDQMSYGMVYQQYMEMRREFIVSKNMYGPPRPQRGICICGSPYCRTGPFTRIEY